MVFYRKGIESEGLNEGINEGLNQGIKNGTEKLYSCIKNNPGLRTPVMAEALGVALKTVEGQIKKLKEKGRIKFSGSKKTGGYYIETG
ncbi:MAG: winged helix-turn-helix domain-containing protein [Candidatus Aminicenantes bacterium]|nr:winged helix-turn-helix domain-containing protein [Candidatus Aminicenantes bacterium]